MHRQLCEKLWCTNFLGYLLYLTSAPLKISDTWGNFGNMLAFSSDPEEFSSRLSEIEEKKKKPPAEQTSEPIQKPAMPGSSGPRSWPPKVNL